MSQSLFTYSIVSLSLEIETEREISLSLSSLYHEGEKPSKSTIWRSLTDVQSSVHRASQRS